MSPAASIDREGLSIEREIKIPVVDPQDAIERILRAGAALGLPRHWERNWVLDRAEELLRARSLLRVRDRWSESGDALGAVVTVKRPLESAAAAEGIKERHEEEVAVADAAGTVQVFSRLDYRVVRRYHKVRTAWWLDEHEIVLDETPIGPWIEIEGPQPSSIARQLGLPEQGDLRNYLSIYEAERLMRPELPVDMVFAGATPPGFEAVRPAEVAADSGPRTADPAMSPPSDGTEE